MRVRSLKPSPDCDIFCCGVVCIVRVFNQRVSEPTDQACSIDRMLFEGELFREHKSSCHCFVSASRSCCR